MKTEGKRRRDQISSEISSDDDGDTRKKDEYATDGDSTPTSVKRNKTDPGMDPTSNELLGANAYNCTTCNSKHVWGPWKINGRTGAREPASGLPGCVSLQSRVRDGDCFFGTMLTYAKGVKHDFNIHNAKTDTQKRRVLRMDTAKQIDVDTYNNWMQGPLVALCHDVGKQYVAGIQSVLAYTHEDGVYKGPPIGCQPPFDDAREALVCEVLGIGAISKISNDTVRDFCKAKFYSMEYSSRDTIAESLTLSYEEFVRWVSIQPSPNRHCDLMNFYYWGDEMALEIASGTLRIGFDVIDPFRKQSPLRRTVKVNPGGATRYGTISLKQLPGASGHYEPVRYEENENKYIYEKSIEFLDWAYKCEKGGQ